MDPALAVLFYIFVATFGIFIFSLVSYTRIQKKRHFKCPECGYRFKPGGPAAFFSRKENVTDRLLYCPRCHVRNYMENIEDSEWEADTADDKAALENTEEDLDKTE